MKFYVLAFCFFVSYVAPIYCKYGPKSTEKLWEIEDNCLNQTGDSVADVDQIRQTRELPSDGKLDKFAFCILKKYFIILPDNTIHEKATNYFVNFNDPDRRVKAEYVKSCVALRVPDLYESARIIFSCILKTPISLIDDGLRAGTEQPQEELQNQ